MAGRYHDCEVRLFDYSHTAAPDYYTKHWHTVITLRCPAASQSGIPDFVVTPGHYLERYLVGLGEVELADARDFSELYRLYARSGSAPQPFLGAALQAFLVNNPGYYLEVRDGVMLAFRRSQALADAAALAELLQLAELFYEGCRARLLAAAD